MLVCVLLTIVVVPRTTRSPTIVAFPPTHRSLAIPTPPDTTRAPVVVDTALATLVANSWPVKFKAPLTCRSLSIVVKLPAGFKVKLPLIV